MSWLLFVLKVIWAAITGKIMPEKSEKELEAERNQELGALRQEQIARRQAMKEEQAAVAHNAKVAQQVREVQAKIAKSKPKRKVKPGAKVFLFLLVLPFIVNCAAHNRVEPLAPVVIKACPAIPLPDKPQLPNSIVIPEPESGKYCFTEAELQAILDGVDGLLVYSGQLEDSIKIYNESNKN